MADHVRLIGVGAGPKNLALAALASALRAANVADVRVTIYEASVVGANWDGRHGYTDGTFPLDTSPLKDLGFPYRSGYGEQVDAELGRYSFIEYLKAGDCFSDWVNRGDPQISHARFAEYLRWAARQVDAEVVQGRVIGIGPDGATGGVSVRVVRANGAVADEPADGAVVTGPGAPQLVPVQDVDPARVFNARSYWANRERVRELPAGSRVLVIGGGQSAGTIAASILHANRGVEVDVVNGQGFLCAQSSGFTENSICTHPPPDWAALPVARRREILSRVNNGVVEASIKRFLDREERLHVARGRVTAVRVRDGAVRVEGNAACGSAGAYAAVVVAIGFDPAAPLRDTVEWPGNGGATWDAETIEVDEHLRLRGLAYAVHAPCAAGLSQGPGIPLLSCLGSVASRIMSRHVPLPPGAVGPFEAAPAVARERAPADPTGGWPGSFRC